MVVACGVFFFLSYIKLILVKNLWLLINCTCFNKPQYVSVTTIQENKSWNNVKTLSHGSNHCSEGSDIIKVNNVFNHIKYCWQFNDTSKLQILDLFGTFCLEIFKVFFPISTSSTLFWYGARLSMQHTIHIKSLQRSFRIYLHISLCIIPPF